MKPLHLIIGTCALVAGIVLYALFSPDIRQQESSVRPQNIQATAAVGSGIRVVAPQEHDIVTATPIIIKGEARSDWYLDNAFPITLEDTAGNEVAFDIAEAQSESTTAEYVPFVANVFAPEAHGPHVLILKKDEAVGDKKLESAIRLLITLQ